MPHPVRAPQHRAAFRARQTLTWALAASIGLLLFPVANARAQEVPPPPVLDSVIVSCGPGCDIVNGVVFDSISMRPLEGALVVAKPTGAVATTDALGGFVLISDARVERLEAFHTDLDALGVSGVSATRPTRGTVWRNARLFTPSLAQIWPRLCGEKRPVAGRSTLLQGTVRLADGITRAAGAQVLVRWKKAPYSIGWGTWRDAEATTDSMGNYLICGVEAFIEPSIIAVARGLESGVVNLPAENRAIQRVDLLMASVDDTLPTRAVRGRVVDSAGTPIAGMRISIAGREGEVVTGADGAFTLTGAPAGTRMLLVRALGYSPVAQVIDVTEQGAGPLVIPMARLFTLDGVLVTARTTTRLERQDFEMRRRSGLGQILDTTVIAKQPNVRAALALARGVSTRAPGPGLPASGFEVFGSNGCPAAYFIDGVREGLIEANALALEDLAAIEVYRSAALAPTRFVSIANDLCPIVLFWTRYGLRP